MRIEKLRFANLNSLKGEWEIDFLSPDFEKSGIFAITGATGAGKSTILDAVTLALYGRTPRLKKITASENELMNKESAYCYAEVEFRGREGRRFRSSWSQHRARQRVDGRLQSPMILLEELPGEVIESRKISLWEKSVEEATGLDFGRFTRSVLLAQGNFAAFLKAGSDEKSEILEKMTGADIYRRISMAVFEKMKEARNSLNLARERLEGIEPMSGDERESLERELLELGSLRQKEAKEKERLDAILKDFERLGRVEREIEETLKTLESSKIRTPEDIRREKIAQGWSRARELIAAKRAIEALESEISRLLGEIETLQRKKSELGLELEEYEKLEKEARAELEKASETIRAVKPSIKKALEIDVTLSHKREELRNLKLKSRKALERLREPQERRAGLSKKIVELEEDIKRGEEYLRKHSAVAEICEDIPLLKRAVEGVREGRSRMAEIRRRMDSRLEDLRRMGKEHEKLELSRGSAGDELERARRELDSAMERRSRFLGDEKADILEKRVEESAKLISTLEEYGELYRQRDEELRKIEERERDSALLRKSLENAEEERKRLNESVENMKKMLEIARKRLEAERAGMSLSRMRERLEEGVPCPLCGSLEHPWAETERDFAGNVSEAEREVERFEKELEESRQRLSQSLTDEALSLERVENNSKELKSLRESLRLTEERLEALGEKLPKKSGIESVKDIDTLLEMEREISQRLGKRVEELQSLDKAVETLEERLALARNTLKEREHEVELSLSHIEAAKKLYEREEKALEEEKPRVESHEKSLAKLTQKSDTPYDGEPDTIESLIVRALEYEEMERELRRQETELSKARDDMLIAKQEERRVRSTLEEYEKETLELQKLTAELEEEREKLIGDRDPAEYEKSLEESLERAASEVKRISDSMAQRKRSDSHIRGALEEKRKERESLNMRLREERESFEIAMGNSPFKSEEELEIFDIPAREYEEIVERQKALQEEISRLEGIVEANGKERETLMRRLEGIDPKETKELLAQADMELRRIDSAHGAIGERLENDGRLRQKSEEALRELERRRAEYELLETLSALVGSSDGSKFSKFAQTLTMEYLIILANSHLQTLEKRYRLRQRGTLDLEIIDSYQADTVRHISTLSGGESFLVSLALALALSDLAGDKISIDTLFLDEGFGTLDSSTLDTVLSALDTLHSKGKMIGIISHVQLLKERIPLSIEVSKKGGAGMLDERYKRKR
jgi:exonuclease SbcC